jgi:AcrR family transcriptional regulator
VSSLRERNRQRTRGDITEAALALFERHGYEATTVEQIARAAGVSSATLFRYFPSKEDILFAHEDTVAQALVAKIAARPDRSLTVAALAEPVAGYALDLMDERLPRLTHLVMTNRSLEPRSLRMRFAWEQALARQLAAEDGVPAPAMRHTLLAAVVVSCLSTALRYWDKSSASGSLPGLVRQAFEECGGMAGTAP